MARAAGKKQAPAKIEEDDDAEGWEDAVVDADDKDAQADMRLRDWRDVERYREMKELRRLVDDDYGLEEIFHVPLKPRNDATKGAKPAAKGAPAKPAPAPATKPAAKPVATKPAAAKPVPAKPAAAPAAKKPNPKLKAKAKRR